MRVEALSTVVAALESGKRPKGGASGESGTIPSLGGEHLNNDGGFRLDNLKYIEEQFFVGLKKGSIRTNDILIVKDGATTGKVSYVDSDFPFERAAINEHLFALTVDAKIASPRYVFSYLKSAQGQKEILKDFRGAAIGGISRGFIDLAKIPLPSLDDQIRIAHLLGKLEVLIAQRKQHLQQLDDLLKSVFLEMFGDPVRNEKMWDTLPFSQIGKFTSGGTPSKSRDDYWIGEYPWVSPKDMKVPRIFDSEDHISSKVFDETSLKRIAPGHLLIVVRGMILAHSFPVAINMVDVAINQDMKAIKLKSNLRTVYVYHCLKALKRQILKLITTAGHGTKKFDSDVMAKLLIPVPPPEVQDSFLLIADKVENIKSRYQQSLVDLEALYGALSQQSFKGELNLSRVSLPVEVKQQMDVVSSSSASKPSASNPSSSRPTESSEDGREETLTRWFRRYLNSLLPDLGLDSAQVLESAWQALQSTQVGTGDSGEEEEDEDFSLADYELLKSLVFEALDAGKLLQTVDNELNRVVFKKSPSNWGAW